MGGDHGCETVIDGVKQALQANFGLTEVYLVGDRERIDAHLAQSRFHDKRLRTVHASEVLAMEDKPVEGLRRKKDCSVLRAVDLVKEGRAEALISPGNTGGLVAAATIRLRKLPGVDRVGIATVIPAQDNEFVLLDSGASVECRPMHLVHYAIMGSVYAREILGCKRPRVGILSNGTEDNKGNELTLEAFKLCKQIDLHFIGNVEGYDLFHNRVDVAVCDGFVGNIVLKTIESLAQGLVDWLKKELSKNPRRMLGALLAKNALRTIKRRMDPDAYGGAPLLGLNGNVMKAHGSSRDRAVMNAMRLSTQAVQNQFNQIICQGSHRANDRLSAASNSPAAAATPA